MHSEKPVSVCFVIDNLTRAGTEMQLLLLLKRLDRAWIRPYLCLLDGESDTSRQLEPDNVPIIRLGVRRLKSFHAMRQAYRLWQYLRENKIDVVQTYFLDSTRFAAPIAKAAGVRFVFGSRRNIGHWMTKTDTRIARFYNCFFIDKIVANCEAARRSVIEQESANPDDVIVVPNIIDLDRFKHIPPWKPKLDNHPRKVGMVGNLRNVKGPDIFIQAAKVVLDKYPDTVFEIAGSGEQPPYLDLIHNLGVGDHVRLLGPVVDIPTFLATLDIAVLPSRAEGFSNALLEYMAAGRPIVATDVGENSQLLDSDTCGLVVQSVSYHDIAAKIHGLLCDPEQAALMSSQAQNKANKLHRMDYAADLFANSCMKNLDFE